MNTITAQRISVENWTLFGSLANIENPDKSYALSDGLTVFHRDMVLVHNASTAPTAFGSLKVEKRPFIIQDVEYHSYSQEVMMPLDDDMVMYAGPANGGTVELNRLRAFLVPAGVIVIFRAGVWHGAPYPIHHGGTVLVCLPERTYLNDTKKVILDPQSFLSIELHEIKND